MSGQGRYLLEDSIRRVAKTIATLMKTAYVDMRALERTVSEVLDRQAVNRFLIQYDEMIRARLSHEEALDMIANLFKRRLNGAIEERR